MDMYVTKRQCLDTLFNSLKDNQLGFRNTLSSPDNQVCEFEIKMKEDTPQRKMLSQLANACCAASQKTDAVKTFWMLGRFRPDVYEGEDNQQIQCAQIDNMALIIQDVENHLTKIEMGVNGVVVVDYHHVIDGNGKLTKEASEILDVTIHQCFNAVLRYLASEFWEGLEEANNKSGYTVDYSEDEDEETRFAQWDGNVPYMTMNYPDDFNDYIALDDEGYPEGMDFTQEDYDSEE